MRDHLGYRLLDAVTPRVYHERIGSERECSPVGHDSRAIRLSLGGFSRNRPWPYTYVK
jgi:hypothetical protein